MNDNDRTTLPLKKQTRDRLKKYGYKAEPYDSILNRLMDNAKELK